MVRSADPGGLRLSGLSSSAQTCDPGVTNPRRESAVIPTVCAAAKGQRSSQGWAFTSQHSYHYSEATPPPPEPPSPPAPPLGLSLDRRQQSLTC